MTAYVSVSSSKQAIERSQSLAWTILSAIAIYRQLIVSSVTWLSIHKNLYFPLWVSRDPKQHRCLAW